VNESNKRPGELKFLFNDPVKKIAATAILIFAIFSLSDVDVLLFQPVSFNQLNVNEGKIIIGPSSVRGGTPFTLIVDKQRIRFTCAMGGSNSEHCLQGNDAIKKYQGKIGKVWWAYGNSSWFGHRSRRLYQLEVNGEMVISYQEQKNHYNFARFPIWIVSLVLAVYWFIKLQFKREFKK
jgi:hypothetical protein